MNDDEMKESWRKISGTNDNETLMKEAFAGGARTADRRTALMRLADRYRRFIIISGAMIFAGPLWMVNHSVSQELRPILATLIAVYFGACAVSAWYLRRQVKEIDVLSMPTAEVIVRAAQCRKTHLRNILILLPMALALLGLLAWNYRGESAVLYGLGAGIAAGVLTGLNILRIFMNDYKNITPPSFKP